MFATRLFFFQQTQSHAASSPAQPNAGEPDPHYSFLERLKNKIPFTPYVPHAAGPLQQLPSFVTNQSARHNIDVRVSGLGPSLSNATLNGGWQFTPEVFDRPTRHPNATIVSWESPRVLLIRHFLTEEEVAYLIDIAKDGMQRSEVVSDEKSVSDVRTSYGAWLNGHRRTDVVLGIQDRIAKLTGIPEEFGESIYILRYAKGERYEAHTDHCHHASNETPTPACVSFLERAGGPTCGLGGGGVTCGDRLATIILYLHAPERGGATVFPMAKHYQVQESTDKTPDLNGGAFLQRHRQRVWLAANAINQGNKVLEPPKELETIVDVEDDERWYCREDAEVLKVFPHSGDAVLFYDYVPGVGGLAAADPASAHAGCPPLAGTKIIATRWMRSADFH